MFSTAALSWESSGCLFFLLGLSDLDIIVDALTILAVTLNFF